MRNFPADINPYILAYVRWIPNTLKISLSIKLSEYFNLFQNIIRSFCIQMPE